MDNYLVSKETYLAHHGIKGQKWGVRRYQNPDGSLTAAGAKRYPKDRSNFEKSYEKSLKRASAVNYRSKRLRRATNRPRWLMSPDSVANREAKLNRSKKRYERSLSRATLMYNRLQKRYSTREMSNLDSDTIAKGRDIAARLNALNMSY